MAYGESLTGTATPSGADTSSTDSPSSPLAERYRQLHRLLDEITADTSETCTEAELVEIAVSHERAARRMYGIGLQRLVDVDERDAHRVVGESSITGFVRTTLRLGSDGRRRLRHACDIGRFHGLTGQRLEPDCPATAEGVADGEISDRHLDIIRDVRNRIPHHSDAEVKEAAESTLAYYACRHDPKALREIGARILAHIDPDGECFDQKDRARDRRLILGAQDAQLMSALTGRLDPMTRAMFEVVLAVWAAPGMNNPADEQSPTGDPCAADPELLDAAVKRDRRSPEQRNHDAFAALLRYALNGDGLGKSHRGLPPQLIITISESALREAAGLDDSVVIDTTPHRADDDTRRLRGQPARTATGSLIRLHDVVEMAARAQQHLAVFQNHTSEVLYFGRSRRLASRGQRLAACARDGGCTCPGCNRAPFHSELHHITDWAAGGTTDIDNLTDCCGPHNRAVGPGANQWSTTIIEHGPDAGRVHWQPPQQHPTQTPQTNHAHDPGAIINRMLAETDNVRQRDRGPRQIQHVGVTLKYVPRNRPIQSHNCSAQAPMNSHTTESDGTEPP